VTPRDTDAVTPRDTDAVTPRDTDAVTPRDTEVAAAADILRHGGTVCFPTETYYGIAADARDAAAVARVVAAKGRAEEQPIAVIAPDADTPVSLLRAVPARARELAAAHWPGPHTIVARAVTALPPQLVGPGGGVGVRVSSHPWAAALARAFGGAITATSANVSGAPPTVTAGDARAQLGGAIDLYLDGGVAPGGPASTVVEITPDGALRVLRAGAISL
jgi:L-threonylcarbamoyladenylate synthase